MVSFYVYDISFLVLFIIGIIIFLVSRKHNLTREGIMFLYRTQLGVKAINYIGTKFHKTIGYLRYLVIAVGFALMAIMIWMLAQTIWIYISRPEITELIKAPPVAPLIPYFPEIFGMESLFPPFYFTYFLVALAVVAIVHEFTHGIFMKYCKTKIKSTGIVFLGPILGAFVEENKESFQSKKRIDQMSVLGAGVFANVVFGIIFYLLYIGFFYVSFTATGYQFNSYSMQIINKTDIGESYAIENYTAVIVNSEYYFLDNNLKTQLSNNNTQILAYDNSPAFKAKMQGIIVEIDQKRIHSQEDIQEFMKTKNPGDPITIITLKENLIIKYKVILAKHPENKSEPYLGIGYIKSTPRGILQKSIYFFTKFQNPSTYYEPTWNSDFVYFIYHLFWWVMIINFLVALFNMLPLGMLDGGRFFYLTIEKLTGNSKFAKFIYKYLSYLILFCFFYLLFLWFVRII